MALWPNRMYFVCFYYLLISLRPPWCSWTLKSFISLVRSCKSTEISLSAVVGQYIRLHIAYNRNLILYISLCPFHLRRHHFIQSKVNDIIITDTHISDVIPQHPDHIKQKKLYRETTNHFDGMRLRHHHNIFLVQHACSRRIPKAFELIRIRDKQIR